MSTEPATVSHITFGQCSHLQLFVPRDRLGAGGTRRRYAPCTSCGHGSARIARALGVRPDAISASSAATPAPSARTCATRSPTSTTPGGTNAPTNAPAPNAPPPRRPQTRHRR